MPRRLIIFTAVLCVAGMISFAAPIHPLVLWPCAAAIGLAAALLGGLPLPSSGRFVCDRCKFDDPRYCSNPERPNATRCPEFRPRD